MSEKSELREKLSRLFGDRAAGKNIDEIAQALTPLYEKYKHLKDKEVMVLFSGGLDTSFITHFLSQVVGAKVNTLFVDVGSVTEPAQFEEVNTRAIEVKAAQHQFVNARETLAKLGFDAIQAEAQLGNGHGHHPASSLSRVVICEEAVKYAKKNNIKAVFHGSNGSQNNPYRYHAGLKHFQEKLNYSIEECTPNLGETSIERNMQQRYLKAAGITLKEKAFEDNVSHDRNLLGDEWEEARIANPNNAFDVRKVAFKNGAKTEPTTVKITFAAGRPAAIKLGDSAPVTDPVKIFEKLNTLGKDYHLGIYDYPEGRPIGLRAREIHIAPAMHILVKAHNWLRSYQQNNDLNFKLNLLSQHWSHEVMEDNRWTGKKRQQMDEVFAHFNKELNGTVTMVVGPEKITSISSPNAAMHMEGTKEPASREDVERYVDGRPPHKPRSIDPQSTLLDQLLTPQPGMVASR